MSTTAHESVAGETEQAQSQPLLGKGMLVLFIALIACFTAWGIAQDLTTPMVAGFKRIFDMSTFQASLVQLAYFGAYFLLALPAAFINQRFGYKTGILTGLALAALGAFLFYPASKIMTYEAFLVALFAMAAGCSILETSANPYVMSLGSEATATRRLNLAQAFNPVGTNIGVLLASTLILPRLADPVDIGSLTPAQLHTIRAGELGAVMGPYLGLAFLLAHHRRRDREPEGAGDRRGVPRRRPARGRDARAVRRAVAQQALPLRRRRPVLQRGGAGVHVDVPDRLRGAGAGRQPREGRRLPAGQPAGLPVLALSHDLGDRLHPRRPCVLAVLAFLAVGLCLFAMSSPNMAGVIAVVSLSFCLSLMFPTIYGVALTGLGPATKFGAAGLVMAIVGGAIMPLVQGKLVDATSAAFSFIVPAGCFAVVGLYALYDLRAKPSVIGGEPARNARPARPALPARPAGGAA